MSKDMLWENGKLKVKIPVSYEMYGTVTCEFDSVADMLEKLDNTEYIDHMPMPKNPIYVDASYEINMEVLTEGMLPAFVEEQEELA